MPVINMPIDLLLRLVNADRKVLDEAQVAPTLHDMGVEVDELTTTRVFGCVCQNVIERTEAQGEPVGCPRCGSDFREQPDRVKPLGTNRVARLDMLAVRPDIFDAGGMARYMRGFLGARTGLIDYPVAPPKLAVQVDPRLAQDESYRPCIACAVIRNIRFDHDRIKLLMNLQEDLHWALGRDRKLASIGVYDLGRLQEDRPFQYRAVAPDELRFVPLGFPADGNDAAKLTPGEILKQHKTGIAYAHLLAGFQRYPLLTDGHGTVLSMPPIINSENTRVERSTTACFVDVTGLAQRTVDRALNILLGGLKEAAPELTIEAVQIRYGDHELLTPNFAPTELNLDVQNAADTLGVALDGPRLKELLERMGHGVASAGVGMLRVRVPAWRNDVMHPVDLIEDAAVAYGYDKLVPRLVPTFTVGQPRAIEEHSATVRRIFTGLGFHQVITLPLTNARAELAKWRLDPDAPEQRQRLERMVELESPISTEQTHVRASLLPGVLATLALNRQYDLPQNLFELGDCCCVDPQAETGARDERFVAAAMIGTHVGYADIRAVCDAFARELHASLAVRPVTHASFIPGRAGGLYDQRGRCLGTLGELHPEVLENHGLRHPAVVLELSVAQLLGLD